MHKRIEYQRAWRVANKEKKRAYDATYRARNRKKINEYACQWALKNPEKRLVIKKRWEKANPDKVRIYKRRSSYGTDGTELFAHQNGLCALCEADLRSLPIKHVHLDHCHETRKVRGWLCVACNSAIGRFRDDPTKLRAAANYLESPPSDHLARLGDPLPVDAIDAIKQPVTA